MSAVLDVPATSAAKAKDPVMTSGPDFSAHPAWFHERQQAAWHRFEKLPMPTRTDEQWRFADVKAVNLAPFHRAQPVKDAERAALLARSNGLAETAGRLVFANDRIVSHEFHGDALRAKGVIWLPLEQAIAEQRDLIEKHFMREDANLGSRKFAALHESQVRNGTFLYIPRGLEITLPVEAFHWLSGDGASIFPHSLIIADELSKVTLVDHFQSAADEPGLACGANDIIVGNGAKVTYVSVQQWSRKTLAFRINNTVVTRDAAALALVLNLGAQLMRSEAVSHLRGPGGRSDMLSISAVEGTQVCDQRTLQIHEAPNTASDLLYKNALNDTARTIFTGLIRVDPGAHKTDAYQKVRNLLLSDEAEANSAPGLEIDADDVRCTHGATSGQVDVEELFYLLSRGIPMREAQQLVVFGFLNEVLERLPDEAICEMLRERLHGKLG
ncbi:MAG: Fe-S cluster assembly protein SufD [Chthoniobacteraceae bacterium]